MGGARVEIADGGVQFGAVKQLAPTALRRDAALRSHLPEGSRRYPRVLDRFVHYHAIGDDEPDRITPLDVIVTAAVNSRIGRASELRLIHRGIAERCDRLLAEIPQGADILEWDIAVVAEVVHEAAQVDGVAIAAATKILHRKRPDLIPVLDSVLVKHYLQLPHERELPLRLYDKGRIWARSRLTSSRLRVWTWPRRGPS